MQIRHAKPSDYGRVIGVVNTWWGGREMAPMLPKLFFVHFEDTSFVAESDDGRLGIHLTHFSGAQWNEGVRVARDQLLPGDLVFFDAGPLGPGHVGIYIGGGEFLHAPHTGDVVKISSLSEPHYALAYVGAVRPYPG